MLQYATTSTALSPLSRVRNPEADLNIYNTSNIEHYGTTMMPIPHLAYGNIYNIHKILYNLHSGMMTEFRSIVTSTTQAT